MLLLLAIVCFVQPSKISFAEGNCDFHTRNSSSEMESCYHNLCRCNETYVSCAHHNRSLTYIPKLNDTVLMLDFSFNYIPSVTNLTFLNVSVSEIRHLWLRHNHISFVASNAFSEFEDIKLLDLTQNPIVQADLKPALDGLMHSRLECLALSNTEVGYIDKFTFNGVPYVNTITFTENSVEMFDFSILINLKRLQILNLSYNGIVELNNEQLTSVTHLLLHYNNIRQFPKFCRGNKTSPLQVLNLSDNYIESVSGDELKCLTSLQTFLFVTNKVKEMDSYLFSSLSNLRILKIIHVFGRPRPSSKWTMNAINNSNLKQLYANDLEIEFDYSVSKFALKGCTALTFLRLSYNRMAYVTNNYMTGLLGDLVSLEVLELAQCRLKFFPDVISKRLINIKELNFFTNQIKTITKSNLNGLTKLEKLVFADNGIHTIDSGTFPPQLQKQLRYINLCHNSFSCTCDILWFIKWMKKDHTKFGGYPNRYRCDSAQDPKSTRLIDAPLSDEVCTLPSMLFQLIVSISAFTIIVIALVSVLYRWRWHIRYHIHMLRYKRRKHLDNDQENNFTYDAFVLFCDENFRFVRDRLMPEIEERGQLTLCVHQRDFTPGKYIVDNIVDSLETSRKVILLLSNTFSESSWCEFELALVQKRAIEKQGDYLVVILLEDMNARKMTSSLYALLQTTTYITWPEEEKDREMFWLRVRASIKQ